VRQSLEEHFVEEMGGDAEGGGHWEG
jgi:hypothetical protein